MNLRQWLLNFTRSPKTSIGGIVAALIIALPQLGSLLGEATPQLDEAGKPVVDENGELVYQEPSPVDWQALALAATLLWLGGQSRDGDRRSEDVRRTT